MIEIRWKLLFEPSPEKANYMFSEQVQHKSGCSVTEAGQKLEILDLRTRESVLSV